MNATAFLATINLLALAGNLAKQYGGAWDEHRARRWLVQGDSPFLLTNEYGVFYSVETPTTWLEPEELVSVTPTEPRPRVYRSTGDTKRSAYKRRYNAA